MTETSAKKPSLAKKMLAFFMLLVFVLIGAGVVLYARQTQTESKPSVAKPLAEIVDPAPSSGSSSNKLALTLPKPILGEDNASGTPVDATPLDTAPISDVSSPTALGQDIQPTAPIPANRDIALAEARLNQDLATKISDLQKDVLQLMEKNAALTSTVETLQKQAQQGVQRDLALLLAANHLQAAWQKPAGFTKELTLIENLAQGDHELLAITTKLQPAAQSGLPTPLELQTGFTAIAASTTQQQARLRGTDWAASWAGAGVIADALGQLSSLVTIRRTGGDSANPLDRDLQKIQSSLDAQQWAQAASIVQAWPGEWQSDAARAWSQQLQLRADAENALWALQDLIVSRLGQPVTN
jgi:hypothetical protein